MEFQEGRAQGKKRNQCIQRPKKLGNVPSAKEIDLKLQKLLLDIENENKIVEVARLSRGPMLEKGNASTIADLTRQELHLKGELDSETERITALGCNPALPSSSETEVIDLTSPLPIRDGSISKHGGGNVECVDIIDLSESENESSPDHVRKARELRLFIASIKDD